MPMNRRSGGRGTSSGAASRATIRSRMRAIVRLSTSAALSRCGGTPSGATESARLLEDPLGLGADRGARVRESRIEARARDHAVLGRGVEPGEEHEIAGAHGGARVAERDGAARADDLLARATVLANRDQV